MNAPLHITQDPNHQIVSAEWIGHQISGVFRLDIRNDHKISARWVTGHPYSIVHTNWYYTFEACQMPAVEVATGAMITTRYADRGATYEWEQTLVSPLIEFDTEFDPDVNMLIPPRGYTHAYTVSVHPGMIGVRQ